MKGRVVILDELAERQIAALVVDGRLEELAIDPADDAPLPGAIYRAVADRPMKGQGGLFLRLPQGWRASTFTREAEAEGVLVRSADEYALIHGRAPHAVRLALAGNIPLARYEAGLKSMAALLSRPPYDPPAV